MEAKEVAGAYEVPQERHCRCVIKVPRTGLDYVSGWGMTDCAKCGGFIKWGMR